MTLIAKCIKILEGLKSSVKDQKTSAKQLMCIIKEKGQSWNSKYFRDTVLNGGLFSFLKNTENVLHINKEVMHFCMIKHHVLKLLKHRSCFKKVILI